jgi:hypothetical protein
MSSSLSMTGVQAEVTWGYHVAAALGPFEISYGFLRARVVSANAFHLTQSPLVFEISNGGRPPFRRRLFDVSYTGPLLMGRLGPKI